MTQGREKRVGQVKWLVASFLTLVLLGACQQNDKPADVLKNAAESQGETTDAASAPDKPVPPSPPITEDFEGAPKLSLFPRLGDYRPEADDKQALPFWNAYLEHLERTSGVVQIPVPLGQGVRAFSFRSVAGLDSLGFFSPLAVEPETTYRVNARVKTELPEGGETGIGILEFDQFLWLGEQYPHSLAKQHQTGAQQGLRLTGHNDWEPQSFTFTTGPKTRMVHLVIFREGAQDRTPVLFDDISVVEE